MKNNTEESNKAHNLGDGDDLEEARKDFWKGHSPKPRKPIKLRKIGYYVAGFIVV